MKVYLAARYDHRQRLAAYRDELRDLGFEVTSRWLDGFHVLGAGLDDKTNNAAPVMTQRLMAQEDWADVLAADALVFFCEPEGHDSVRGGRHVEFGAALALGKHVLAVGDNHENVFHHLAQVWRCRDWEHALNVLLALPMPLAVGAD